MHILQSIFMGIVQGLSEFLPISSSGHLVFASNLYKDINGLSEVAHSNQEIFFDIMLHFGTLIAVFIFFRREIFQIIKAVYLGLKIKNYDSVDFKTGIYIILGTVITVIIACPLSGIAAYLVFNPQIVSILLLLTGLLLIISENVAKKIGEKQPLTLKKSILIAIAQGFAALPGFSRSGLTIAIAILSGMSREVAARYSFLLSIPIILGASMVYPFAKINFKEVVSYNWLALIIGTVVSAIVGYFCIKYFIKFVSKFSLSVFGYYCLFAGLIFTIYFRG